MKMLIAVSATSPTIPVVVAAITASTTLTTANASISRAASIRVISATPMNRPTRNRIVAAITQSAAPRSPIPVASCA